MTASAIWGFAFVAQRVGMDFIGPFAFNALRFLLGGLVLVPFIQIQRKRPASATSPQPLFTRKTVRSGVIAGSVLFGGASLQQIGIITTTAGKAGFITGLYVILVPLLGLLWKKRTRREAWLGAILAVWGLYLLSVTREFTVSYGDLLVLLSAFFWAFHVQIIDGYVAHSHALVLACLQFLVCALLSAVVFLFAETTSWPAVYAAGLPILYAGLLSTGVAYTLQVVAQREAHPAHAAILLSLEAVFAVLGGWLLLSETLSERQLIGCALMLAGMMASQLNIFSGARSSVSKN